MNTGDPCGFNKGHSSKFGEGSRVQQTSEEGWRTYRPKRCGNNNKDEDNSPKTLNDKNQQAPCSEVSSAIRPIPYAPDRPILELHGNIEYNSEFKDSDITVVAGMTHTIQKMTIRQYTLHKQYSTT